MSKQRFLKRCMPLAASLMAVMTLSHSVFAWTNDPLVAGTTQIRKIHIDELRSSANSKETDFGYTNTSWTDSTITSGVTQIRKAHVDQLRTAINAIRTTYNPLCSGVIPAPVAWTDSTITAGTTRIKATHITELRSALDAMGTCLSCERAAGGCRDCNGGSGFTFVANGSDPTSDCTASGAPTCNTGNCNGSGGCITNPITCYQDLDGDGYGNLSVSQIQCGASCTGGYVAPSGDCCDALVASNPSAANVNPGQVSYFTTAINAPSCASKNGTYDYNCSNANETQAITNVYNCPTSCAVVTVNTPTCGTTYTRFTTVTGSVCGGSPACAGSGALASATGSCH